MRSQTAPIAQNAAAVQTAAGKRSDLSGKQPDILFLALFAVARGVGASIFSLRFLLKIR